MADRGHDDVMGGRVNQHRPRPDRLHQCQDGVGDRGRRPVARAQDERLPAKQIGRGRGQPGRLLAAHRMAADGLESLRQVVHPGDDRSLGAAQIEHRATVRPCRRQAVERIQNSPHRRSQHQQIDGGRVWRQLLDSRVDDALAQRHLARVRPALDGQQPGDAAAQGQRQRSAHQPQANDADTHLPERFFRRAAVVAHHISRSL